MVHINTYHFNDPDYVVTWSVRGKSALYLTLGPVTQHSTSKSRTKRVMKIRWTWSDVVIFGQILDWSCFVRGCGRRRLFLS